MTEPYYRALHVEESDVEDMGELLVRIHAERNDPSDKLLLEKLYTALTGGVRYGGQSKRKEGQEK